MSDMFLKQNVNTRHLHSFRILEYVSRLHFREFSLPGRLPGCILRYHCYNVLICGGPGSVLCMWKRRCYPICGWAFRRYRSSLQHTARRVSSLDWRMRTRSSDINWCFWLCAIELTRCDAFRETIQPSCNSNSNFIKNQYWSVDLNVLRGNGFVLFCIIAIRFNHTGWSKKRHKVYGTMILQLYMLGLLLFLNSSGKHWSI